MRTFLTAMQAATIAGVMGLSPPLASEATAGGFASATNTETGVTTTSVANPDGTRTVTTSTPGDGVAGPSEPAAPDASAGDFASSTNPETGVTTTSVANPDGTHTVTTSSNGDEEPTADGDSDDEEPTGDFGDWVDDFEEWGDDDWDDNDTTSSNGDDRPRRQTGWTTTVSHGANGSQTVIHTGPNGEQRVLWTAFGVAPGPYEFGVSPNPDTETWEDWTPYLHPGECSDDCEHTETGDGVSDDSEDTETGDASTFEASETGDATGTFEASETGTNAVRNAVSVAVNNVAINVGIRSVTHGIPQMPIHVAPPRVETPRPTVMLTAGPSRPFGTQ